MSDGCISKKAAGPTVFLVEELSDARVRFTQLKSYVQEGLELISKSEHKDAFFEMAGHILHGIPDTLFKLEKALDAAAMSGALMDYESVKESVRPEKADVLDSMMEETRIQQLKRHSGEAALKQASLISEKLEADLKQLEGKLHQYELLAASETDSSTQKALEDKVSDFKDYVSMFRRDLSRMKSAGVTPKQAAEELLSMASEYEATNTIPLGRILDLSSSLGVEAPKTASEYIDEVDVTPETFRALAASLKEGPSREKLAKDLRQLVANSREKVMEGFRRANPGMSEEALEKAADNWEKHKDNFKSASNQVLQNFKAKQKAFLKAAQELDKAWPKSGTDEADAANEAYPRNLPSFDEFVSDISDWVHSTREETFDEAAKKDKTASEDDQQQEQTAEDLAPQMARFEEGKPADPTSQMSEEDAAKWKTEHAKNKDNFKAAADVTKAEWEKALKMDEAMLKNIRSDIAKMGDGEQVNNLTLDNAKAMEKSLEQVIENKKKLLSKFASSGKSRWKA